jgi:hypothetical protein
MKAISFSKVEIEKNYAEEKAFSSATSFQIIISPSFKKNLSARKNQILQLI